MENERFFNRELSWVEFNARVLEEALNKKNPLLERLKFLIIVSSNFDEFYMVRAASLKAKIRAGDESLDSSGLSARGTLAALSKRVREIIDAQYKALRSDILPSLAKAGITLVPPEQWSPADRRWLERYFIESVAPVLTPLRVESDAGGADIFPMAGNLRVHAAFLLKRGAGAPTFDAAPAAFTGAGSAAAAPAAVTGADNSMAAPAAAAQDSFLALVQVPPNLKRLIRLPSESTELRLVLLEDLVSFFGGRLFPGFTVSQRLLFKVTRDADIGVDEDRDIDFIAAMEEVLADRQNSFPVCLCASRSSPELAERIRIDLGLDLQDLYTVDSPLEVRSLGELAEGELTLAMPESSKLLYKPWPPIQPPQPVEGSSVWDEIKAGDRLLHLPYESFDPIVRFLDEASLDPRVLAIKMTLYRTSGTSPVVKALTRAARSGKQVVALVEVKARFDEERNIGWASRLEQAGAIVVYGLAHLKVHAKAALVVRREESGAIKRYLHLSTGNYNEKTARLYADLSIFTANDDLCSEASVFFNMITGYSAVQELHFLAVAPFDLKKRLISMIERETERSLPEAPGLIMAKLNSLADPEIIRALYRASAAGVSILLNVRGVSMLVPGQPGCSEHIRVVSIVGRYLEHARIVYFKNGGAEELYLSSADWMPRNFERRVELLFPVLDEKLRKRVFTILSAYFKDNAKAHELKSSGRWERIRPKEGEASFSAQDYFYETAKRRSVLEKKPAGERLQVRKRPSETGPASAGLQPIP